MFVEVTICCALTFYIRLDC